MSNTAGFMPSSWLNVVCRGGSRCVLKCARLALGVMCSPLWDKGVRIGESWTVLFAPRFRGGVLGRAGGVDGRGWVVVVIVDADSGTRAGRGGGSCWLTGLFLCFVRRSRVGESGIRGSGRDF